VTRVDETPDYVPRTRPRSTVRVIGTLLLVLLVGAFLVIQCVRLYVESTPKRTLEVRRTELAVGVPKLYPLPSQGSDAQGTTFGVWLIIADDGTATALLSRDPFDGCAVAWRTEVSVNNRRFTRAFRSPCHGAVYDIDGNLVSAPTSNAATHPSVAERLRGLDRYDAEVRSTRVVVSLERLELGPCGPDAAMQAACSRGFARGYVPKPPDPILLDVPSPTTR
jgi:nitrite reductase/ring-hydroxylating ferredoxin subunit